jgi:dihydrofolate synthase/folylpolyglutamate synthase
VDSRLDGPISDIYRRYNGQRVTGPDEKVRHPEWTARLLDALGRPDAGVPVIMVTGSKGKGSTAWYLASILAAHGLKTGLFQSPHLLDNLERLRINGRAVAPERFLALYGAVHPHLDRIERQIPPGQYQGPVGIFAALAALWFAEEGCDVAVFETGRGARFDDVVQVRHVGAVITAILLEHRHELGSTLDAIAWHKLGIVRPETAWVVMRDHPSLRQAWADEALGAEALWDTAWALSGVRTGEDGTRLVLNPGDGPRALTVPALAHYAAGNVRRAVMAASRFLGPRLDWAAVRSALAAAWFPGRAELLPAAVPVVLDGAVRRESARDLLKSLREAGLLSGRLAAVSGVPEDKDWQGVARELLKVSPVEFVRARNPRLTFPGDPVSAFPGSRAWPDFAAFWGDVLTRSDRPDLVLVLGTQSLVGDVLAVLGEGERLLDLGLGSAFRLEPPLPPRL